MEDVAREVLSFFSQYRYFGLIPVALIEGPIIGLVAGFLASIGVFSVVPTLVIIYLGDVISDLFFYSLGKGGKRALEKKAISKKISEHRISIISEQYENSPWRTMIVAKVAYGFGTIFMTIAGASKIPFLNFLKMMMFLNIFRSIILFSIGFYFGKIIADFGSEYFYLYIIIAGVLVSLWLYVVFKVKKQKEALDE